jgi:hypothetical protein
MDNYPLELQEDQKIGVWCDVSSSQIHTYIIEDPINIER